MTTTSASSSSQPPAARFPLDSHTYQRNMIIIIVVLALFEGLLLWLISRGSSVLLVGAVPLLLIMVAFQLGMLLEYRQIQNEGALIIDDKGIELRGVHRVRVPWAGLVRFDQRQGGGGKVYYGFELAYPVQLKRSSLMQALFGGMETDFLAVNGYVDIPTRRATPDRDAVDYAALRNTTFGQAVMQHKPELLEYS